MTSSAKLTSGFGNQEPPSNDLAIEFTKHLAPSPDRRTIAKMDSPPMTTNASPLEGWEHLLPTLTEYDSP